MKQKRCRLQPVIRTSHSPGKSYHPCFLHGASALATTLLPEHPVPGASRSTIAHSKFSGFCADRSSWLCSGGAWDELRIRRSEVRITLGAPSNHRLSLSPRKKPNALLATAREDVWFAVDCAGGGPGAMVTPVQFTTTSGSFLLLSFDHSQDHANLTPPAPAVNPYIYGDCG